MKIYCLINKRHSISDKISQLLFDSAQEVMSLKDRNMRISLTSIDLRGEITTKYVVGFMGSVSGIEFTANIDWEGGSAKTTFLVKPVNDKDELLGARWQKVPLFGAQHEAECGVNN